MKGRRAKLCSIRQLGELWFVLVLSLPCFELAIERWMFVEEWELWRVLAEGVVRKEWSMD
jgi:hypothetical protein